MGSPAPTIYLTIIYLAIISSLSFLMNYLNAMNMKFTIIFYRIFSILLNVYISVKIINLKYISGDFGLCTKMNSDNLETNLEVF